MPVRVEIESAKWSEAWLRWRSLSVIVAASVVLAVLEFLGLGGAVRWPLELSVRPLTMIASQGWTAVSWPVTGWWQGRRLQYRLRDLELRYAELVSEAAAAHELRQENAALRQMIENTDRSLSESRVAAPITAYGTSYVGVGSRQGVEVGDPVVFNKVLLGRVSAVSPTQSRIELLTQANPQPLLAKVQTSEPDQDQVSGLVSGDGRQLLLSEVATNAQLEPGQIVVTAGQVGVPPGLVLGQVIKTVDLPTAATQQAVIDSGVSFFDLQLVEVLLQGSS